MAKGRGRFARGNVSHPVHLSIGEGGEVPIYARTGFGGIDLLRR